MDVRLIWISRLISSCRSPHNCGLKGIQNIGQKDQLLFGFFKLTSIVNAAMIFFQLYLQDQRDEVAIILLVVTGIDIGFDFLEMSAGCAALGMNKDKVYPYF